MSFASMVMSTGLKRQKVDVTYYETNSVGYSTDTGTVSRNEDGGVPLKAVVMQRLIEEVDGVPTDTEVCRLLIMRDDLSKSGLTEMHREARVVFDGLSWEVNGVNRFPAVAVSRLWHWALSLRRSL